VLFHVLFHQLPDLFLLVVGQLQTTEQISDSRTASSPAPAAGATVPAKPPIPRAGPSFLIGAFFLILCFVAFFSQNEARKEQQYSQGQEQTHTSLHRFSPRQEMEKVVTP